MPAALDRFRRRVDPSRREWRRLRVLGALSTIPGTLYAFSANGTTNCSGTPTTCLPLWSAAMGTTSTQVPPSPAVSGGVVYDESADGTLYAFDAGVTNCSGTPRTCTPLWTAALSAGPQYGSSPAVANGIVYAPGGNLEAFDANGTTNCAGTPKTCTPLWSYNVTVGVGLSSPSLANGLVFIGSGTGSSRQRLKFHGVRRQREDRLLGSARGV